MMPMPMPHMGFNSMMPPFGCGLLGAGDSYYPPHQMLGQFSPLDSYSPMGAMMQPMGGLSSMPGLGAPSSSPVGSNDSVRFIQRLGSGAFGEVWKAEYRGEVVAAKVTDCPMGFRGEEIDILKSAQGQHTARLIAVEERTPKGTAIIMELYSGSLLDHVAASRGPQQEGEFLEILVQLLEGLEKLHADGIIFGDLKPDNLLLDDAGRIVFSDFGDARDTHNPVLGRSVHEMGWGSPNYHAKPDVMAQSLTFASDMWMLGQTAIHIWSREEARCNPSPVPGDMPLMQMVQQCFASQPEERPTAAEMLKQCRRELKWLDAGVARSPVSPSITKRRASVPGPEAIPKPEPQTVTLETVTADLERLRRKSLANESDYVYDMRLGSGLPQAPVFGGDFQSPWMLRPPSPPMFMW
jgi:serine/threonine protein kinase